MPTTNTTTSTGLSPELRTFYSDVLLDRAKPNLVFDRFAQHAVIPKHGGKTISFRRYSALEKATSPLTEGVTPNGSALNVTKLEAQLRQYGDYVLMSDLLVLTAIDDNLAAAAEVLGEQCGLTLDTLTRDVVCAGTNVQYAAGEISSRSAVGAEHKLTVEAVKRAVATLKRQNARRINGFYIGIIHPDCAYDLMRDEQWLSPHEYRDTEGVYSGELGSIAGVRFVESSNARVFASAGADGQDVYCTMILGADAYGTVELEGGTVKLIVKQLGSAGSADPLDQRASVGWKASHVACRLNEQYMVRIESASSFNEHEGN